MALNLLYTLTYYTCGLRTMRPLHKRFSFCANFSLYIFFERFHREALKSLLPRSRNSRIPCIIYQFVEEIQRHEMAYDAGYTMRSLLRANVLEIRSLVEITCRWN